MSQVEEDALIEQFRADGTFDWMRQQANIPVGKEPAETEPEEVEVPEEEGPEILEGAIAAPEEIVETPIQEEEMFLDLTPETEELLKRFGGDLNKALQSAADAQKLINRQGGEVGDLRKQNEEILRQLSELKEAQARPQLRWPDEDDEPEDAVEALQSIAESAFYAEDLDTFVRAYEAWKQIDPLGANAYSLLKQTEARVLAAQPQTSSPSLEQGVNALLEKYPQLNTPDFQAQLGAELQKLPTLGRLLRGEIPGTTPAERVAALEELAQRVASRQVDDNSRKAQRRVAVRNAEEAAKARREARVAQESQAKTVKEEEDVRIPLGTTKMSISKSKVGKELEEIFGTAVEIGE